MSVDIGAWYRLGRFFPFAGQEVFHVDTGPPAENRPILLLIHGFPTASWDFVKIWPALCAHFRVLAADMLGFGYSGKPRRHRYSILEQADLFEALLEHCGVERQHVLAHDYGDTVAQELLARDNARRVRRVQSVCFLNGGLFPETHRARLIQKLLLGPLGPVITRLTGRGAFERSITAVFGPNTAPTTAELDAFWALINHGGGRIVFHKLITYMRDRREHRERWVGALQQATCPLAVIDGAADPVSGAHMVARYRELVGKGYVAELPGIGHYPQVEAPEQVTEHYFRFLSQEGLLAIPTAADRARPST